MPFDIGLLGAFVAGFLSFASPCVLPLVPPYLCFLAGVSLNQLNAGNQDNARRDVFIRALAFVSGFVTVFVALGASASFLGKIVSEHLSILGYVAGIAIIAMGLHFLGLFRIGILYREARFHVEQKPVGLLGAYVVGLAFAFGWTPCVGPILAAILFVAGAEDTVARGMLLLAVYGLGIGLPFLAAAAFAGPFLSLMTRFRHHMATVEKVMGGFLVLTGMLFLTGNMQQMGYWLLEMFPALGAVG